MLSFVTLISYDYRYAFDCISSYYAIADEIFLGLDADRLTWSKQPFDFDMAVLDAYIRQNDPHKKIKIVESNFHPLDHPMHNETYERNVLSKLCKEGNWVLQIDSDERVMNPQELAAWAGKADPACMFSGTWLGVFKAFGNKIIIINAPESTPVGTKLRGAYTSARRTSQPNVAAPLKLLHYSWGRSEGELWQKLTNWGHARDFDTKKFFDLWKSVSPENYASFKNIHPLGDGSLWPSLKLIELQGPAV